ncbi:LRR receptor-like serine threonine-protein kinase [Musa troglodytarum]|uniref:LRR receptor-like serine threonine-protein kinase n=1 Tax=Musa troglodytarum TaxID=320322 RepID=A0A9E7FH96_9LILI|nr:LRR receptor-like serine threonine-protein kinase [Musa troglodytarum]
MRSAGPDEHLEISGDRHLLLPHSHAARRRKSWSQAISAATDREVLLQLKDHLEATNPIRRGAYARWNASDSSPCNWPGITCNDADRVTGINLAESNINGEIFPNFHLLPELTHLDLSSNTIGGSLPADLNKCSALEHLNLSANVIAGELNLAGLTNLVMLDLTSNRFNGSIRSNFPAICANLVSLNISSNSFSGDVTGCFDKCPKLEYLDLSSNLFDGYIWQGFQKLRELFVSENHLNGELSSSTFASNCALEILDLSTNNFSGTFPGSIANCSKLTSLDLRDNAFMGEVPSGIGSLSELNSLRLGNNAFDRTIPEELLNCSKLVILDFSSHDFGGDIPEIFGRFVTLDHLILYGNQYTGGIESSGILKLPDLTTLNLSKNRFSGTLPVEITTMPKIKILILAYNGFSGSIPPAVGGMARLQLLDLSYNKLTGSIPLAIGNLTSLLWLTLAGNDLTGNIPPEIGNCSSLMWLNLANNRLSGRIPPEISAIGSDPNPTFEANRREIRQVTPVSGDCLTMNRWLPASYPPFNFVYMMFTKRKCRATWDRLLQGYAVFPICSNSSSRLLSRGYPATSSSPVTDSLVGYHRRSAG